ncbi:hypothetical protein HPP92_002730 [Vanilla planifolia]|uniref:NAC domain-containing protein n=1 Tax=Vanilla planifolia TaxID=51239 RepID=A0A835VMS1_VANPL|nr:hypothetical protein HPP92_003129 [Vanilla planifolia]KAG0502658.1 hypothetical protein HPP92_002730 [Vanilla planifolia]
MNGLDLQLPPGFRFHPTDEELVVHYLCRKCASMPIAVPIVAEVDLYKYDPWLLPGLATYGDKEWYFFSPRDRKYPNGSRPNRAAGSGYWKATGADKPVGSPRAIGIKKALVFYVGKAPRGEKTNWIMHEYRLADVNRSARLKNGLRLDDWVLCRIYNKKGPSKHPDRPGFGSNRVTAAEPGRDDLPSPPETPERKPFPAELERFHSESIPRLHHAESSCSEHVLSPDMVTCEKGEAESHPRLGFAWDVAMNYANAVGVIGADFLPECGSDPLHDILMFLQKPF